ncbi:sugar ABC transporter ATP-binding protein [Pararhodobacter sp. CCB-MM2]|uniref:sugar ABC transporter ATP-binding protein n=1 Tax=Pararhodobacter sp. CCB-MM2 TaxID=1786003 RepID=UPI00082C7EB0|nr:sugar ABC transporter ATP-binding protein [Pararhodobacter sp. CCB-MM2]
MTPFLALDNVSKSFGPIEVLHGISLQLRAGEVHALIGENGAGKSTTMKILAGYQPATSGAIRLEGQAIAFPTMRAAEERGIVMIHQEFNLAEPLTVEQNMFLGRELRRGPFLRRAEMARQTRTQLDRVRCRAETDALVRDLSNSDKQMLEIAKALSREAKLLIMDEPTAVLTPNETEILFEQVRELRAQGAAVLFTSHKLDEVKAIADRVTIMRDGRVVHSGPASEMTEHQMAEAMVGRELSDLYPDRAVQASGAVVLRVRDLDVPGHASGIGLELHKGEILGIAGMVGSGRTEAMEGLCGLRPAKGHVEIDGQAVTIRRPSDALSRGLCYLTEDRKTRGLLLGKSMRENVTLQAIPRTAGVMIDRAAEEAVLDRAIADFDIRAGARSVKAGNLSGGNQQKLLLAKVMQSDPRILIVDEPTRGIDIGTKQQIYRFLRDLAGQGLSVIVVSSEMQELIGLCDRVMVMREGRITGQVTGQDINERAIVRLAMGLAEAETSPRREDAYHD